MELMRKISFILLFAYFIFMMTACRNMQEEYVYGGKISGSVILIGVIDNDYSGITVYLSSSVITSSVTTLASGAFSFTDLQDGTYQIDCSKAGYATKNVTGISIEKSSSWTGTVYLTPDAPPSPPVPN